MAEETHLCIGESLVGLKGPEQSGQLDNGQKGPQSTQPSPSVCHSTVDRCDSTNSSLTFSHSSPYATLPICIIPIHCCPPTAAATPPTTTCTVFCRSPPASCPYYPVGQWRTLFMRYHHLRASVGFQLSSSGWIRDW